MRGATVKLIRKLPFYAERKAYRHGKRWFATLPASKRGAIRTQARRLGWFRDGKHKRDARWKKEMRPKLQNALKSLMKWADSIGLFPAPVAMGQHLAGGLVHLRVDPPDTLLDPVGLPYSKKMAWSILDDIRSVSLATPPTTDDRDLTNTEIATNTRSPATEAERGQNGAFRPKGDE